MNASGFELCQHGEPEFGTLVLRDPQTQQLLVTLNVDTQGHIDGLVDDRLIFSSLNDNAIKVHNRIDGVQGPGLPDRDLLQDPLCDLGDKGGRHISVLHFLKGCNNFPGLQPLGIQGQDLVIHLGQPTLVLG